MDHSIRPLLRAITAEPILPYTLIDHLDGANPLRTRLLEQQEKCRHTDNFSVLIPPKMRLRTVAQAIQYHYQTSDFDPLTHPHLPNPTSANLLFRKGDEYHRVYLHVDEVAHGQRILLVNILAYNPQRKSA